MWVRSTCVTGQVPGVRKSSGSATRVRIRGSSQQNGMHKHNGVMRSVVAVAMILLIGAYSAPVIRSGGFGGWVIAFIACALCPLVVAAVAGQYQVVFGLLANAAIVLSFVIRDRWVDPSERGYGVS